MNLFGKNTEVSVILEQGPDGLRAKEFDQKADPEHWDHLWEDVPVEYGPAQGGHLPHQLRSTFTRIVRPPARVLEAGCGPGHFAVALHARGYNVVAVDWAERVVDRNKSRFPSIDFRHGDVRNLPEPDGSFDAVYSPGVCEHFEDGPDPVLLEALRVLRPGGVAVVSTPCLNSLRKWRWGHRSPLTGVEFYQYLFSPEGMTRTLSRLGLCNIRAHPYGVWAALCVEWPRLASLPMGRAAGVFDLAPGLRQWGASCIWTGIKGG